MLSQRNLFHLQRHDVHTHLNKIRKAVLELNQTVERQKGWISVNFVHMVQKLVTIRLLSHWQNQLHENGGMRHAIFLPCNCPITFHETSLTDATGTSVSATFAITFARDRMCRFLGDQLRGRMVTVRW
jgi:hypothetical protein